MTKFALPALIACIFALFSYSVTSQSNDSPSELTELPTQKITETATHREQPPMKAVDRVGAELQRLSDEAKANSEKIAQTATLRSDLLKLIQDAKASSDKLAQNSLDQINAIRSDQEKTLKDVKDTGERNAQALRDEIAASQVELVVQIDDALKANAARSEALTQRVDVVKKEIEEVKKDFDEDRQSRSNLSPGFALLAALAAVVLGPFVAYQITANQLASIEQQATATAARSQTAEADEVQSPPVSRAVAEPSELLKHDSPPLSEDTSSHQDASFHEDVNSHQDAGVHQDADAHPQTATDTEKV